MPPPEGDRRRASGRRSINRLPHPSFKPKLGSQRCTPPEPPPHPKGHTSRRRDQHRASGRNALVMAIGEVPLDVLKIRIDVRISTREMTPYDRLVLSRVRMRWSFEHR